VFGCCSVSQVFHSTCICALGQTSVMRHEITSVELEWPSINESSWFLQEGVHDETCQTILSPAGFVYCVYKHAVNCYNIIQYNTSLSVGSHKHAYGQIGPTVSTFVTSSSQSEFSFRLCTWQLSFKTQSGGVSYS
jgi:hypothetical protein